MSDEESDDDFDLIRSLRSPSERKFRQRENFLDTLDDISFLNRFRLSKENFTVFLLKIRDNIISNSARSVKASE